MPPMAASRPPWSTSTKSNRAGRSRAQLKSPRKLAKRGEKLKVPMPTALVLGGYGLIGSACCRALAGAGFRVVGAGRSRSAAMTSSLHQEWIFHDLSSLKTAGWTEILDGVDVVVNAAGALQEGPRDDLEAIHATMLAQLCAAAAPNLRIVLISACLLYTSPSPRDS